MAVTYFDFLNSRFKGNDAELLLWAQRPRFANVTERNTFYGTVEGGPQAGMECWTADYDVTWRYNGSSWQTSPGSVIRFATEAARDTFFAGDGSGTKIDGVQVFTLDRDIMWTSRAADWLPAGGTPIFHAYQSSSQSIPNATATQVANFATSLLKLPWFASNVFTAQATGSYLFGGGVGYAQGTTIVYRSAWLGVNGAAVAGSLQQIPGVTSGSTAVSVRTMPVSLTYGDTVSLWTQQSSGAALLTQAGSGPSSTTTFWATFLG